MQSASQTAQHPVVLIGDGNLRRLADWRLEEEAEYWRRAGAELEQQLSGRTDAIACDSRVFIVGMLTEIDQEQQRRQRLSYRRADKPFDLGPVIEAVKARAVCLDVFAVRCEAARRPSGRTVAFRCPFHDERTASLIVFRDSNRWHCFGCSDHGDVIAAVMKLDGLTFVEAVLQLAREYGVEVPKQRPTLMRAVAR